MNGIRYNRFFYCIIILRWADLCRIIIILLIRIIKENRMHIIITPQY